MNVSLPADCEMFGGWFRLYRAPLPEADESFAVRPGGIELVGGRYTQTYVVEECSADVIAQRRLQAAKEERAHAVAGILVTVDGMVFDGDETSQGRMARAITAAQAAGADMADTIGWVLADNTVAQPSLNQLASALRLACEEQTRLWTVPYEGQ